MTTLLDSLVAAARTDRGINLLGDTTERITYADLARRAERAAGVIEGLQDEGHPVLIVLPTGPSFLDAFWGSVWAGRVPAPLPTPRFGASLEEHARRIAHCASRAGGAPVLTTAELVKALGETAAGKDLRLVDAATLSGGPARSARLHRFGMIQFSSGSLGDPKGVILPHSALAADVAGILARQGGRPGDVILTWIPLVHDLGLIGGHFSSVFLGCEQVLIPTERIVLDPAFWMRAVHEFRATCSSSPPFGFAMAKRRTALEGLDLSSLRTVVTGAEPIDVNLLREFQRYFAPVGLAPNVCSPSYGLAECCVGVTSPAFGSPLVTVRVAQGLEPGRAIEIVGGNEGMELVSVGTPLDGLTVEVRRQDGTVAPPGEIGEIHVKGPAVFEGYWGDPSATEKALRGGWLVTGDLGFVYDGQLFIAGRQKDVIIVRGRHYFPEEIEGTVTRMPEVRGRGVVAFGVVDPSGGAERVVVVAETTASGEAADAFRRAIAEVVADAIECNLDEVVLVPPRSIPRTPSGKLRRSEARRMWGRVS